MRERTGDGKGQKTGGGWRDSGDGKGEKTGGGWRDSGGGKGVDALTREVSETRNPKPETRIRRAGELLLCLLFCVGWTLGWLGHSNPMPVRAAFSSTITLDELDANGFTGWYDLRPVLQDPVNFTVQVNVTGAPVTCDFFFEGSLDGVNPFPLDSDDCAASVMFATANAPVNFIRVRVANLTGGAAPAVNTIVKAVGR